MKKHSSLRLLMAAAVLAAIVFPMFSAGAQQTAPAGQANDAGQRGANAGGRGGGAANAGGRGGGGRGGAAAPAAAPLPLGPVTGNAALGKANYMSYTCYGCHGFNGETGRALLAFTTQNLANEENFIAFLRLRGDRASMTPSTGMPNFPESSLSDKQAKDIYAYIRTFKSSAPELKDIPTLNAIVNAASRPYKP